MQDRQFIHLGCIISLSLAMNGCPFNYLASTIYKCLSAESLEDISLPVDELPPDKRGLVGKVHSNNNYHLKTLHVFIAQLSTLKHGIQHNFAVLSSP